MLRARRIAFGGPGVMAEAMVAGLIDRAGVPAAHIRMSGPRGERLHELVERYDLQTTTDNRQAVNDADIVVVSVKPQSLVPALTGVQGAIPAGALVLSIVAGARLANLSRLLGHACVVRSMPNTPAQIGEGITVWTATEAVSAAQREEARQILGALGPEIFAEDEDFLDMATALSGTGPAYVFLFMEAMVDAGAGALLPRKSRIPNRDFAGYLGRFRAVRRSRYGKEARPGVGRVSVTSEEARTRPLVRRLTLRGVPPYNSGHADTRSAPPGSARTHPPAGRAVHKEETIESTVHP